MMNRESFTEVHEPEGVVFDLLDTIIKLVTNAREDIEKDMIKIDHILENDRQYYFDIRIEMAKYQVHPDVDYSNV